MVFEEMPAASSWRRATRLRWAAAMAKIRSSRAPEMGVFEPRPSSLDHRGSFSPARRGKSSQVGGIGLSWLDYPHGGALG
jgi:hypothetical protein